MSSFANNPKPSERSVLKTTIFVQPSPPQKPSLAVQMAASLNASVISAIATTPFDVVKTRLQVMDPTKAMARCGGTASGFPFAGTGHQMQFFQLCACGGKMGGVVANTRPRMSSIAMAQCMVRTDGVRSLWKGTGIGIVAAFPSVGIYLTMYDQFKEQLQRGMSPGIAPLVAGGAARSVSVLLTNPLEFVKTRIMAQRENRSWLVVTQGAVSQGGWKVLWRGLVPTLYRDVPFSALYWLLAEATRSRAMVLLSQSASSQEVQSQATQQMQTPPMRHVLLVNLLGGVVGGGLASVITHPFDVVKTRTQVGKPRTEGTIAGMRAMIAKEGWAALWGGIGPRVLKVAPSCAIVLASYEFFKRLWA